MGSSNTMNWANTRTHYGLGAASPGKYAVAGQAAGAGIGAFLGNPLIGLILSQVGGSLLEKFFGGNASPYEQFQQQNMNALKGQLPTIQAQAAGRPSPATQAQLTALRQGTTRAQQSYGSSALGRNVGQTTPTKAGQQRFRVAETQAAGQIMGDAQLAAQQQLVQLGMGGAAGMRDIEMQEAANRKQIYGDIATMMTDYRKAKQMQSLDPQVMAMMQNTIKMLGDFFETQMANMQR